jgi:DNA integrity scanning protein DisA with diadenylate cyclase activity
MLILLRFVIIYSDLFAFGQDLDHAIDTVYTAFKLFELVAIESAVILSDYSSSF